MPYTPLRKLRPELFVNEYETDSDDDTNSDDCFFHIDSDEFNLDGLDIDDEVPNRGYLLCFSIFECRELPFWQIVKLMYVQK